MAEVLEVGASRVAVPAASITTFDLTSGRITVSPKLVLPFCGSGITDATNADHARLSIGAANGTVQGNAAFRMQKGQGTTNAHRWLRSDSAIAVIDALANTVDGYGERSAILSNGWRLNAADAFTAAFLASGLIVGGTGVSTEIVIVDSATGWTLDTERTIGTLATPDAVIAIAARADTNTSTAASGAGMSFGVASRLPSSAQYGHSFFQQHSQAQCRNVYTVRNHLLPLISTTAVTGVTTDTSYELTAWGPTGIGVTPRTAVYTSGDVIFILLKFSNGVMGQAVSGATKTSTGADPISTPGMIPHGWMLSGGLGQAVGSDYDNNDADCVWVSVGDAGGTTYLSQATETDNAGDSEGVSVSNTNIIHARTGGLVEKAIATFVSAQPGGINITYGTASSPARRFLGLVLGVSTASVNPAVGLAMPGGFGSMGMGM